MAKSDAEDARACQSWGTLQQDQRPACAGENGGFMCDKPHTRVFRHVYARPGNRHAALLPTPVNIPPYAAQGVPFRYMSKDYQPTLSERHPEFSDDEEAPFTSSWIYGEHRQHDILSWFRSQVATHESLCVFYCKHGTPVDDDCQRLIVGLGEVTKVHPLLEYESTQDFTFASDDGDTILWEHLGLLDVPEYREAWEKKLAFYQQLGFVEGETLFTTRDHPHGAFTTQDVLAVIEKLKDVML